MTIIALIGPRASGKTTIGRIISEKLRWKFVDFDIHMINYFKRLGFEKGFDPKRKGGYIYELINNPENKLSEGDAWKKYYKKNNRELIKFINKNKVKNMILDLGGRTVTERKGEGDDALENVQNKLKSALRAHVIVIYLSYSRFRHRKTINILFEREREREIWDWATDKKLMEDVVRDYKIANISQRPFADYSFFAGRKTAYQISEEIIWLLKRLGKA